MDSTRFKTGLSLLFPDASVTFGNFESKPNRKETKPPTPVAQETGPSVNGDANSDSFELASLDGYQSLIKGETGKA